LAKFSKQIAETLKLPNPTKYTSHSFKRSSITWMADEGLSLPQIKAATGHKSDTVVQQYIDTSKVQKRTAASAVGVKSSSSSSSLSHSSTRQRVLEHQPQQPTAVFNISGGTFTVQGSGPMFAMPSPMQLEQQQQVTNRTVQQSEVVVARIAEDDSTDA
jgi:hypothetical protein